MKKTEKDFKATSDDMKNQLAESKNGIAEHKKAIEMLEKKVSMGNLALQNEKTKNSEISELLKKVGHSLSDSRLMAIGFCLLQFQCCPSLHLLSCKFQSPPSLTSFSSNCDCSQDHEVIAKMDQTLQAILDDAQSCVDKAQICLEEVGDAIEESKKVTEGKELKVLLQPLALLSLAPHPAAVSVLYSSASCVCT